MSALLEIKNVTKTFRGLVAVNDVSIEVEQGSIAALIGPNGAGKTTLFNLIVGVHKLNEGQIIFDGQPIDGLRPDQICHAGIGRTFQIVRPFNGLSVEENVVIGALRDGRSVRSAKQKAKEVLDQLGIVHLLERRAGSLTLPERKRLEVARALATGPKLLLLDEVMAGLRPGETDEIVEVFRKLNAQTGITVVLIEHVMRAVVALSQTISVLNYGALISTGAPEQVMKDPKVLECYLGEDDEI